MRTVDLRSDTLTRPTPAMRKAMAEAEVGDDVFGEDPTVNRLEEMAARSMGKEAALFVASGTMGNLVAQLTHCGRGEESILGDQSHVFFYEQGGSSALGGIHPHTVPNLPDGTLDLNAVEDAIRPDNIHFPRTRLIILENTHNRCSGAPLDADYMKSVGSLARKYGLKIHVDGARIFNAAAALKTDACDLAADADSVSFCLSKGLAAPVGSLLCGSRDFIKQARRNRKVLGGGMRQAGILAAAGIVALTEMTQRLAEDHENARKLAAGLSQIKGLSLDPERIKTNIVYFDLIQEDRTAQNLADHLKQNRVLVNPLGPGKRLRAVTHYHITSQDIDYTLEIFQKVMNR